MPPRISNIAKNTSFYTLALILQKVISFTYFVLIARFLGPEDLGKYYFAISFTTIFGIFIDLGLANVLTREVAKKPENADKLISSVLTIKIPLAVLVYVSIAVIINILNYPEITKLLVYLSAISVLLDSFTASFFSVIRGFHNLLYESISAVVFQLIVISFGLFALYQNLSLPWIISALVLASIFNFSFSLFINLFKLKIKIRPKIDFGFIKFLLKITAPFALFAIFQKIYTYLDTVLLSLLAGDKYVGLYQVAFKIIFALQFLPMAFMASLYPAFSSYWVGNKKQLTITFERAMNYLIIISLPVAVGIISIADKIILIFKSDFTESTLPLQLIMGSLMFIFLIFPIGALLNAADKQHINTINIGITLAVSIALNLFLIPRFKIIGASITVVLTNILMFALSIYWVPKLIKVRPGKIITTFIKSLTAVFLMALAVLNLKEVMPIFLVILLGGGIYFVVLFLLGGFKKEDLLSIIRSLAKN